MRIFRNLEDYTRLCEGCGGICRTRWKYRVICKFACEYVRTFWTLKDYTRLCGNAVEYVGLGWNLQEYVSLHVNL